MKTKLLTLLMLFGLFSPLSVYGDNVPTKGEWHDDYYRSVTPAPPTVSIDGNLLSIHFIDALDDLTVQVVNEQGAIHQSNTSSKEPPWKVATKEVGTMIILSIAMRMPCYY